ncbi:HAD-IA family hydrolase [Thalassotalea sp. 1_MG-2023]|uniref:HAD-IA family hydrolase n=1 Tax=Thalassotalea sp. 1_MG-2023 TaxID=3062680 RepID=UPI0026E18251|nr:HAD-IA family hydrolase [Thalassotalea sp. 1_MG-2023]MDO6425959.1 HAD-IA family hydrolase [Thalassotalea sp. 1_MG-2023]
MRYNRRLLPFKAISFDLDDTLYHNAPVMIATDKKMQQYFAALLPDGQYGYQYWFRYRQQALLENDELIHDVGELRHVSYRLGLMALGFDKAQAETMAQQAVQYFVEQRSNFVVPDVVHELLLKLASQWPLVAISNGNVDTRAINLAQYFSHIYHAGQGNKQKPAADMFAKTCQQLSIKPIELLHVGDCGINDIIGAAKYGCQTAWVSTYDVGHPIKQLATLELRHITELSRLLN